MSFSLKNKAQVTDFTANSVNGPVVPVRVYVGSAYRSASGRIFASIQALAEWAGYRATLVDSRTDADVVYDRGVAQHHVVDPECWNEDVATHPVTIANIVVPSCAVRSDMASPQISDVDVAFVAYFFLTGRHERGLEQTGQSAPCAAIASWGVLESPVVDVLGAYFARRLQSIATLAPPRPRWPGGFGWAVVLSHDCDRPQLYRPVGYARDAMRFLCEARIRRTVDAGLKAAYSAVAGLFRADPYVTSAHEFIKFESMHEIRSTYYFGTWGREDDDSDPNDLAYNHATPLVRRLGGAVADAGMELGLHSSIRAWESPERYEIEARRFQDGFGVRPKGVRAHWWSLRPGAHEHSLALIARAGFSYDSSFGMNELAGFRRGTSFPFAPFDPVTGERAGLIEMPPTVMDDALLLAAEDPMRVFRALAETVKRHGGVLVLDWHTDTLRATRWASLTVDMLAELSRLRNEDSTCWFCSAEDAADWIGERRL